MLVLSREIGEAVSIDDVILTLARVTDGFVEVSLRKITGGSPTVLTLPHHQYIEICYNVEAEFIEATDARTSFGFEHPPEVIIRRNEFRDPGDRRRELV